MFSLRRGAAFFGNPLSATPMEMWRAAAQLVWRRWEELLAASPEDRADAFEAYLAALDAEAQAATGIAREHAAERIAREDSAALVA